MLSLWPRSQPPILKTVAIEGTGIADVDRRVSTASQTFANASSRASRSITSASRCGRSTASLPFYAAARAAEIGSRETVAHEKVNVAMLPAGESRIELLEAADSRFDHRQIHREARPGSASRGASRPGSCASGRRAPERGSAPSSVNRSEAPAGISMSSSIRPAPVAYYGNLFKTIKQVQIGRLTAKIGIIGGSGLYSHAGLHRARRKSRSRRRFGDPSDNYIVGELEGHEVAFLARHGRGHRISPSELNFRANIYRHEEAGRGADPVSQRRGVAQRRAPAARFRDPRSVFRSHARTHFHFLR